MRKMLRTIVLATLALTLVSTVLTACAPAAQPTSVPTAQKAALLTAVPTKEAQPATPSGKEPSKPPQALKKANVAYPTATLSAVPFYIAKDKGFDKEEGLDATLTQIAGSVGTKAMVAGQFDFSLSAGSVLAAGLQGAPVKVVMVKIDRALFWLYTKPDIKSVKDLKGKAIGVDGIGGAQHVAAQVGILNHGGSTDGINFLALGGAQLFPSLKAGAIDGAALGSPDNFRAADAGFSQLLFLGEDVRSLMGGVGTTEQKIKDDPDLVQRMVNASLKGLRYLKQNKEGSIPLMRKFLNLDEKTANAEYEMALKYFTDDGTSSQDVLGSMIKEQANSLNLKEEIPVEKIFDLSFAQKANGQLDASGWKAK